MSDFVFQKQAKIMIDSRHIISSFIIIICLSLSGSCYSQWDKEISLSAYTGYTLVNFENALGYSDEYLEDRNQFHYSVALRGFLVSRKRLQIGAEIAWQKLYYAYYVVPYYPSPEYYEFNVSTTSLMALCRYLTREKFFAVGGAGIHLFNDGASPAVCLEAGYMIYSGANLRFPLSVRINPVLREGISVPVSAGAGVSYIIRQNR